MIFTVVWLPNSENRLAEIWNGASDRQAVSDAADWLDRALRTDPLKKVTPVDALFFLRREPLIVLSEIHIDDRMVRIIDVQYTESD